MNCQICGAELPSDALFCGECGSSTSATPQSRQRSDVRPSDTTVIQSLRPRQSTGIISVALDGAALPAAQASAPAVVPAVVPAAAPTALPGAAPEESPAGWPAPGPATGQPRGSGVGFVLQFSTGESFDVNGTGLIGRRPLPQAQERFDHLIQITDPGRSVSKTHLEFGQHDGELWVADRASGNGTLLRRPDGSEIRCESGRRYLVGRGSRVEIGEQFFVVA